jgi:hypothetical protein
MPPSLTYIKEDLETRIKFLNSEVRIAVLLKIQISWDSPVSKGQYFPKFRRLVLLLFVRYRCMDT